MTNFTLPGLPADLHWANPPLDFTVRPDVELAILAGPNTTWFHDPAGAYRRDSAPVALFTPPDPCFLLSARVTVDFANTFDAGVLQLRLSEGLWAKLCFEFSPQREPMVVTVVTRERSDDANSAVIAGNSVYLRAAVTRETAAFHYSLDGAFWQLARYFSLGPMAGVQAGLSSQAPRGPQCWAHFDQIRYRAGELSDLRSGE